MATNLETLQKISDLMHDLEVAVVARHLHVASATGNVEREKSTMAKIKEARNAIMFFALELQDKK